MAVAQHFLLLCAVSFPALTVATEALMATESSTLPSFAAFIATHGRMYKVNSTEYDMRRSLYANRLQNVQSHNDKPKRRWNAVINHLSDRTEAELKQLRGLRVMQTSTKGGRTSGVVGAHVPGQFLSQVKSAVLADEKSWEHLEAIKAEVNQQACGSCWALAAVTMLSANAEIYGHKRTYSAQEMVDCTPNPHNCGGNGGCTGSTVELGLNWVMQQSLDTEEGTPYQGVDTKCKKGAGDTNLILKTYDQTKLDAMIAVGVHSVSSSSPAAKLGLQAWERLPENEYEPLIRAVAERGPAAVSVAADAWSSYGGGVFDSCSKDAVIDHAVTLVGYGMDLVSKEKFWVIKNSWGNSWGEDGKIRLLRHEGNVHCGTDNQPKVGTACDGGPASVKVCGMCGILYDAVVPHFQKM